MTMLVKTQSHFFDKKKLNSTYNLLFSLLYLVEKNNENAFL